VFGWFPTKKEDESRKGDEGEGEEREPDRFDVGLAGRRGSGVRFDERTRWRSWEESEAKGGGESA